MAGPVSHSQFKSLLGNGVFNSDGTFEIAFLNYFLISTRSQETCGGIDVLHLRSTFIESSHRFHRSITRPFFTRDRITDLNKFDQHVQHALKKAKVRLAEGHPIDFQVCGFWHPWINYPEAVNQDLVARFTLDSVTEFLFDDDVHSLDAPLPYPPNSPSLEDGPASTSHPSNVFIKAFVRAQGVVAKRTMIGSTWPLFEFWKDMVAADRKTLDQYVQPSLDKCFRRKRYNSVDSRDIPETLLDYLVDKTSGE